ncbi:FecR family protein [Sunxiuqinia sp. A32]|uniref:FecR family protein n=1 Tax=Sunxiuqinia sp. A32 TaxID=3461496 RepID=UPI00404594B6
MKTRILKYLSGKDSSNESGELLKWLRTGDHLNEFKEVKQAWEVERLQNDMPADSEKSWNSVQFQLIKQSNQKLQTTTRYLQFYKYAAIIVVAAFIGSLAYNMMGLSSDVENRFSIVKADNGQIANIVLPDQTEVWLNSGSYIKYNNEFAASNREIELVGEAYFDVTKNPDLPLVVTGSKIRVKVLGTKFNVSAYEDDNIFNVALEEGSIELGSNVLKNFSKMLKPGEMATFDKQENSLSIRKVNVDLFTSWKDGMINLYNLPLEEVVLKLSKRYNQKFEMDDDVRKIRYTYTIKNESLSDVLKLMETITPVYVVQEGDVIHLKSKRN